MLPEQEPMPIEEQPVSPEKEKHELRVLRATKIANRLLYPGMIGKYYQIPEEKVLLRQTFKDAAKTPQTPCIVRQLYNIYDPNPHYRSRRPKFPAAKIELPDGTVVDVPAHSVVPRYKESFEVPQEWGDWLGIEDERGHQYSLGGLVIVGTPDQEIKLLTGDYVKLGGHTLGGRQGRIMMVNPVKNTVSVGVTVELKDGQGQTKRPKWILLEVDVADIKPLDQAGPIITKQTPLILG